MKIPQNKATSESLLKAASAWDIGRVSRLLGQGADVNARDAAGATPVIRVIKGLDPASAKNGVFLLTPQKLKAMQATLAALLAAGADVNLPDRNGITALLLAVLHAPSGQTVRLLLKHQADFTKADPEYGNSALHWAFALGNEAALAALLPVVLKSPRWDADSRNKTGASVLHHAPNGVGSIKNAVLYPWIDALIQHGAQINGQSQDGQTPLMRAADLKEDPAIVTFLLSRKALPDLPDKGGATPLMHAAAQGHVAQCKALITGGANVNARDGGGNTALMWVVSGLPIRSMGFNNPQIVTLLLDSGTDTRIVDREGQNALALAKREGASAVIMNLLKRHTKVP